MQKYCVMGTMYTQGTYLAYTHTENQYRTLAKISPIAYFSLRNRLFDK